MSRRKLFFAVSTLLFATAVVSAGPAKFAISTKREKWTGLAGLVLKEGEQVDLPDSLWEIKSAAKPDGDVVIPKPVVPIIGRARAVNDGLTKFDVADPVQLRIRGKGVKFEVAGSRSTTIPGDYDGLYLAYSLKDSERQLTLTKKPGKETEWKIVNAEQGVSKSLGEYQYNITQTVRFRLEAVNRLGWYLDVDKDRRLVLTADEQPIKLIEMQVEMRYDDLNDGK